MRTLQHVWVGILAVALFSGTASAGLIGSEFITIDAQSALGTGSTGVEIPPDFIFPRDGIFQFELPAPLEIRSESNVLLGTVESLTLRIEEDPAIAISAAVLAPAGVDSQYTISSAVLTFPAINNPGAFATAGFTVTDNNGNGATLTGLETGGTAYKATYNGSTDWAFLVNSFNAPAFGSATNSGRRPTLPTVFETIPASVSSMQATIHFQLTAEDQASVTSRFEVIPEPTSLALMGIVAGALLIRRRSVI